MTPRILLLIVGLLNSSLITGQVYDSLKNDTLKVVANTKFGEITFTKYCKINKLEFLQSKDPIFDKRVEKEAFTKNIHSDTLEVEFYIDEAGKIKTFKIVKKSKLKRLNQFLMDLFNDAILKIQYEEYTLNCNNRGGSYTLTLFYERQKVKKKTPGK